MILFCIRVCVCVEQVTIFVAVQALDASSGAVVDAQFVGGYRRKEIIVYFVIKCVRKNKKS